MKFIFLLIFLFCVFSLTTAFSQTGSSENQACNPEFAKILVEQQVSESRTIEETDKRIKILIRAADFLWKFDQPTARKYFTEAFKVANDRFSELGFEDKKLESKSGTATIYQPDYRMSVISAIAKKDGEWAKKLSEQVLKEYEKRLADDSAKSLNETRELNELLNIGIENVKTNPALSQFIFRRLMKYPLDYHWYNALYQIAGDNQPLADQLYAELLQRYADATPRRLLFLSAYPFIQPRIFGVDKYQFGINFKDTIQPNPALQRKFLEIFFRRIAIFVNTPDEFNRPPDKYRLPEAVYIVSALSDIEPFVVQNFPDLLQRLNEAKAQGNALMTEENKKDLAARNEQTKNFGASFEERLKELEKADDEGKLTDQMIYSLATWGDKTEAQFEIVEFWLEKIQDENVRRETTSYFYFKRAELAIKEKRYDDAREFADKVPELEHRAVLLLNLSKVQSENATDTAKFFDTLNEISKLARNADNSAVKAQVLLGLANSYEKVNHTAALNELSEAIRVINQLENPDIFSTAVVRQIVGKGFAFYAYFSSPGYNFETTFEELSKKDFELTLSSAKSLNDKYFKTLAVLAVAKNCVENAPKKKAKK